MSCNSKKDGKHYTYDALHRLTSATYSDGRSFGYTYDASGNVLQLGQNLGPGTVTTVYTYTSNKLSSISGENLNVTFQYSGLGDRLSQTVNGVTTNYTLDLNTGLTQVLQDGTNTYVYGVDRIAQVNGGIPEYFLTDGLGSVRQLVDSNGTVTLAKSYQPYGTETSSAGSGLSSYGFTGEMTDSYIKLIYLRSRWYDPASGRFPTKDSWQGDYNRPLSLNRWSYVMGNPVMYTDPTGLFALDAVMYSFGLSSVDDLARLFQPGGSLQGKWGFLKFLEYAQFTYTYFPGSDYLLWDETGFIAANDQLPGPGRFYRPNISASPCPPMPWYQKPGNGCYVNGSLLSSGYFNLQNNSITYFDRSSGRAMSLLELGMLDVDWYGHQGKAMYYAYEWYPPPTGYDFGKVDKLSLSVNIAGILSPCALTCPEGGPICVVGLVANGYLIVPGIMSTTRNFDRLDMGDTSAIGDTALDVCSNIPVVGFFCSLYGAGRDLNSGVIYPTQK